MSTFRVGLFLATVGLLPGLQATVVEVDMIGHNFNTSGGGRFQASVDGTKVYVWCVDRLLTVGPTEQNLEASLASLNSADAGIYDVRYEDATFKKTADGAVDNAQFRYKMAAWLISQYTYSNGVDNNDLAIQNAIWRATQPIWGTYNYDSSALTMSYYTQAEQFVSNNYNAVWFDQFQIVSGWQGVSNLSGLADVGSNQRQTFLMSVNGSPQVPEPATIGTLGVALLGLGYWKRRKSRVTVN